MSTNSKLELRKRVKARFEAEQSAILAVGDAWADLVSAVATAQTVTTIDRLSAVTGIPGRTLRLVESAQDAGVADDQRKAGS